MFMSGLTLLSSAAGGGSRWLCQGATSARNTITSVKLEPSTW